MPKIHQTAPRAAAPVFKISAIGQTSLPEESESEIGQLHPKYLRIDDFDGFFDARIKALSDLIGSAMGKSVVEDRGFNETEVEESIDEDSDGETSDSSLVE